MKPIWYFVGLFLTATGIVVFGSGIYDLVVPPPVTTVLADLHPGIWWGGVILVAGVLFTFFNKNKTIE